MAQLYSTTQIGQLGNADFACRYVHESYFTAAHGSDGHMISTSPPSIPFPEAGITPSQQSEHRARIPSQAIAKRTSGLIFGPHGIPSGTFRLPSTSPSSTNKLRQQ